MFFSLLLCFEISSLMYVTIPRSAPGVPVPSFPHFLHKLLLCPIFFEQGWVPAPSFPDFTDNFDMFPNFCSACSLAGPFFFFPFGSGVGWAELFFVFVFFLVLNVFPKDSQVLKVFSNSFPQDVPSSTWVLCHMVCTKFNS